MNVLHFVATRWTSLCLKTFEQAFLPQNVEDIVAGCFTEDEEGEVLMVLFKYATCTVKRFLEFSLLFDSFPWAFHRILFEDSATVSATLLRMKNEWEFLKKMEAQHSKLHSTWPVSQINPVRWQAYREVMTFCEERSFANSGSALREMQELVRAWVPNPMSTLGCDKVFRELRAAEARHSSHKQTSVEQLQAVAVKAVNERYKDFETVQPRPADVHSVTPGCFVKKSVFDASRATAGDTGLPRFNAWSKLPTPSPHFLTRRGLNLWKALQNNEGATSNFWTAQLVRSAMVTCLAQRYSLGWYCFVGLAFDNATLQMNGIEFVGLSFYRLNMLNTVSITNGV